MEINTVSIQEVRGSYFVYVPKIWIHEMKLKKGDKVIWSINEGNHKILILKKNR